MPTTEQARERVTAQRPVRSSGLVRYLLAAALVRGADSGAAVGLVLLAIDVGSRHGAAAGGLLVAALSAPHVLGPWTARRLERARDGRRVLAGAYLVYAVALAGGALALGRLPLAVAIGAVAVAGCCGPLLTGGLSSRLAGIAGKEEGRRRRRAQGWDALTYSVGGTAGPAVVAGLAALSGPLVAVLGLAGAAAAGAALTLTLPYARAAGNHAGAYGMRAGLRLLTANAGLRRVTTMTLLSAFELGALPVVAVLLGPSLSDRPGAGATLNVAAGLGGLAGALLVTVFPLRGEPDLLALRLFAVLAAATALCAFAPAYALALAGFAFIGLGNATSFTATLAARTRYAPPSAHAQVFVTSAGLKIGVASAGAALTGLAAGLGGRVLLLLAAALTAGSVLLALTDRLVTEPARPD